MKLADFQFTVPADLVAQTPARPRDAARLMCLNRASGTLSHYHFRDLPKLLDARYTVVVNNSRVIKARVNAQRPNGTEMVLFLLRDVGGETWSCVGDGETVPHVGERLWFRDSKMRGRVVAAHADGSFDVCLETLNGVLAELDRIGEVPLPPYVHDLSAASEYQTVYARVDGSVAAPTAGLHFTPRVLEHLAAKGVQREEITLHVGYGTFAPVRSEELDAHRMPSELYTLAPATAARLNAARHSGKQILAVGTTVTRTLESCADEYGTLKPGSGETRLFIHPPYRFRAVDALLTNFHMPGLTPIMLVAAFAGYELTMRAYAEAIDARYRFYSFGDSMLVL